ncbi:valine--tRNA ligase [Spirochaetia bacterium]|nr:valine--tRNA ligase [Spirochaetia bacterium]
MKSIELEKAYEPKSFEDKIYAAWKDSGAFMPTQKCSERESFKNKGSDKHFSIVIPPPNVTGILHMGHALNITLQDIVIRYHRMCGEQVLWVPGTDHAGIATQNIVEKRLKAGGVKRHDLGREKFVEETWKVKDEHHAVISRQIAKMGASVDWSRERFTMDEGLSKAVREVFVSLYERDLLYKGKYLVNWCTHCGTALSDDEVEHNEIKGAMYHIRYQIAGCASEDPAGYVEIATTRPETLLGDTALAVHPSDERYRNLVGKMIKLPLCNREIPVVADTYVDKEFGTGIVKITPAHDPNDYELGGRNNLPIINILSENGKLNDEVPPKYRGLNMQEARKIVLQDLKDGGFFVKEQEITHSVGHCYRCNTVIEPFLSEQWFVRMKPLADKALAAWKNGDIVFFPKKWEHTYSHWLNNIRDWCVSRQLWWGHRIPAWTCSSCGEITVSRNDIDKCPKCGGVVTQDEDVLDTWFSSWLWPFSTLGWPDQSADLKRFYPTTALVTAYDIIFFWVSRMIMAGLEFTGAAPFKDIYIHGLIRDKQGRKMSKSSGNGIDPLELVDAYGADALKFTLAFLCAQGQDIQIDKESFKLGSKFANKIWNASRYILMNLDGRNFVEEPKLLPIDRWIYIRLNKTAITASNAFLTYRYNEAASAVYEFFWNDFCDWYVEATKLSTKSDSDEEKDRSVSVLLNVLFECLKLLHPLLPFVTEEIYNKLPLEVKQHNNKQTGNIQNDDMLINATYPNINNINTNDTMNTMDERDVNEIATIEKCFSDLQQLISAIRTLRSECTITPDKKINVIINVVKENLQFVKDNIALISALANLDKIEIGELGNNANTVPGGAVGIAEAGFEAFVFVAGIVDPLALKAKWKSAIEKDIKYIEQIEKKFSNENFIKNAPAELVEAEKTKLAETKNKIDKIKIYMKSLGE